MPQTQHKSRSPASSFSVRTHLSRSPGVERTGHLEHAWIQISSHSHTAFSWCFSGPCSQAGALIGHVVRARGQHPAEAAPLHRTGVGLPAQWGAMAGGPAAHITADPGRAEPQQPRGGLPPAGPPGRVQRRVAHRRAPAGTDHTPPEARGVSRSTG